MAIDREATLKNAEKFLRSGRLDAAIAEYVRVVDEYPRDWTTANTLGDLYVRAAQSEKAVALYQRIVDHLLGEGFYPRAAALLKKILKIRPEDEAAQLQLGDISARQGLLGEAKTHLTAVANRRRQRGDAGGADEIVIRLASLDPSDLAARSAAAQALERAGDADGAARIYRDLHDDHLERGREAEAVAALRDLLRCRPDARDSELLLPLTRLAVHDGRLDDARAMLPEIAAGGAEARDAVLALAWGVQETRPEATVLCAEAVADSCARAGEFAEAAAILQELAARLPGQVPALLRLVEVCVDGGLEATMYEAQAQLADAYLASGSADEARVIAEDLVTREPWEAAHVDRLRRALRMLAHPDVEGAIAERLAAPGQAAGGSFEDLGTLPDPSLMGSEEEIVLPAADLRVGVRQAGNEVERHPMPAAPSEEAATPPFVEVDLTLMLGDLEGQQPPPAPPAGPPRDLEEVFAGIRAAAAGDTDPDDQSGEHLALAKTYLEMGMHEQAGASLEIAVRSPRHRFAAAALLARLCCDRGDLQRAIEWYERAAEAPPPDAEEGRVLLYELGDVLELLGENARALAVFMEIDAQAPEYRDVRQRVARLSRVEAGG